MPIIQKKKTLGILAAAGLEPYQVAPNEAYMNEK